MTRKKTKRRHIWLSHRVRLAAHRWVDDGRSWLQLSKATKVNYPKLHKWKNATPSNEVGLNTRTLDRIEKVVGQNNGIQ